MLDKSNNVSFANKIHMSNFRLLIVFILYQSVAFSQTTFKGIVKDAQTHFPIEFCSIIQQKTTNGTLTNEKGMFTITIDVLPTYLQIHAAGYIADSLIITASTSSQIIFLDDDNISSLDYPGDNYLIITASGSFYKTEGNNYLLIPINITDSLEFNSPITITTESSQPPFYINSNVLVSNLNAQYLNGYSSSDFPLVNSQASISGN